MMYYGEGFSDFDIRKQRKGDIWVKDNIELEGYNVDNLTQNLNDLFKNKCKHYKSNDIM